MSSRTATRLVLLALALCLSVSFVQSQSLTVDPSKLIMLPDHKERISLIPWAVQTTEAKFAFAAASGGVKDLPSSFHITQTDGGQTEKTFTAVADTVVSFVTEDLVAFVDKSLQLHYAQYSLHGDAALTLTVAKLNGDNTNSITATAITSLGKKIIVTGSRLDDKGIQHETIFTYDTAAKENQLKSKETALPYTAAKAILTRHITASNLPDGPFVFTYNSKEELKIAQEKPADPATPPATGTPATGTPATGTPATGTPATGTPATGTPATETPATGTPATGTPATGTPTTGTPATETPAAGTPTAGSGLEVDDVEDLALNFEAIDDEFGAEGDDTTKKGKKDKKKKDENAAHPGQKTGNEKEDENKKPKIPEDKYQDQIVTIYSIKDDAISTWNMDEMPRKFKAASIPTVQLHAAFKGVFIVASNGEIFNLAFKEGKFENTYRRIARTGAFIKDVDVMDKSFDSPIFVAMSPTGAFYIKDETIPGVYKLPEKWIGTSAWIDEKFIYLTAYEQTAALTPEQVEQNKQNKKDGKELIKKADPTNFALYVYSLEGNSTTNYIYKSTLTQKDYASIDTAHTPGHLFLLTSTSIKIFNINEPNLIIDSPTVAQKGTYNFTYGTRTFTRNKQGKGGVQTPETIKEDLIMTVNLNVIDDPTNVYVNGDRLPEFAGLNRGKLDFNLYFTGAMMNIDGATNRLHGPCHIKEGIIKNPGDHAIATVKVHPTTEGTAKNETEATTVYIQEKTITYQKVFIKNAYNFKDAAEKECEATTRVSSEKKDKAVHTAKTAITKCSWGKEYDVCLAGGKLIHVNAERIHLESEHSCDTAIAWEKTVSGKQGTVCLTADTLTVYSLTGDVLYTVKANELPLDPVIQNFGAAKQLAVNRDKADIVVVSTPTGFAGIKLPISGSKKTHFFKPIVAFNVDMTKDKLPALAGKSSIVFTNDVIMTVTPGDTTSAIYEYDISNVNSPFLNGKYPAYDYKLLEGVPVSHQIKINHVSTLAKTDKGTVLLVLRPGLQAQSVYLHEADISKVEKGITASFSSSLDQIARNTMFFIPTPEGFTYYWAHSSNTINLPKLDNEMAQCLYCPATTNLKVKSFVKDGKTYDAKDAKYTIIRVEQPIRLMNATKNYTIAHNKPLNGTIDEYFEGTVFDYEFPTSQLKDKGNMVSAFETKMPINIIANLSKPMIENVHTLLFGSQERIFVAYDTGISFVDVHGVDTYDIKDVPLKKPPVNAKFNAGGYDKLTDIIALTYTNEAGAGLFVLPEELHTPLPSKAIKVKTINKYIFVLTGGAVSLINVYKYDTHKLNMVDQIPQGAWGVNMRASDMSVEHIEDDQYVMTVTDKSGTIYFVNMDLKKKEKTYSQLDNIGRFMKYDLLNDGVNVYKAEIVNKTIGKKEVLSTIDVVIYVQKVHSYKLHFKIAKDGIIKFDKSLNCFSQIPGFHSVGQAVATNHYFLDIKNKDGLLYMYQYPYRSEYEVTADTMPGDHKYNEITGRVYLGDAHVHRDIDMFGINGLDSVVLLNYGCVETKGKDMPYEIQLSLVSLSQRFEFGFNKVFSAGALLSVKEKEWAIHVRNDYSAAKLKVGLQGTSGNIFQRLTGGRTWVWWVILGVLGFGVCVAIAWVARREYIKKQVAKYNDGGYADLNEVQA